MKLATLFNKILPVVVFIFMIYYAVYFNLLPVGRLFEDPRAYFPDWMVTIFEQVGAKTGLSKLTLKLSPARNLAGKWVGGGPNGAFYQDNVANPACSYEADIVLDITNQTGNDIAGFISFRVRKSSKILKGIPCIPEGSTALNQAPIKGTLSSTYISFENPGLRGTFSPIAFITAKGTFTTDLMSGTFERAPYPSGGDLTGIIGKWSVMHNR